MVTCDDVVAFADGELDDRAAEFRGHLASCHACQASLVEHMQLSARLLDMHARLLDLGYPQAGSRSGIRP